jgi:hypothetical protein
MIQEKMDVELCLTSVGKLLAQLELTPQKPLRRAYERDPLRIERWKAEEFPKLKHLDPAHLRNDFIKNGLKRGFRSKLSAAVDRFS